MTYFNVSNLYQGSLRFAPFNFDLLQQAIATDLKQAGNLKIDLNLMVTCLDQLTSEVEYIHNNKLTKTSKTKFLETLQTVFPNFKISYNTSPTRTTVTSDQTPNPLSQVHLNKQKQSCLTPFFDSSNDG